MKLQKQIRVFVFRKKVLRKLKILVKRKNIWRKIEQRQRHKLFRFCLQNMVKYAEHKKQIQKMKNAKALEKQKLMDEQKNKEK